MLPGRHVIAAVAGWLGIAGAAVLVAAQAVPAGSAAAPRTVWEGVYTDAQAARGQRSYQQSCDRCHAAAADGVPRRFTGDPFWAAWGEDALESLYGVIKRSMPNDAPGSLSDTTYADIVAFLLKSNGLPAGDRELNAAALGQITLTRQAGGGQIPAGAFVAVSGCLTRDTSGWHVTRGSEPRRSRDGDTAIDSLGDSTFRLMYVISSLDRMEGHKVLVHGLLMRDPVDAVNVMTVQSVDATCTS